jgi:hypothetical protein
MTGERMMGSTLTHYRYVIHGGTCGEVMSTQDEKTSS